MTDLTNSQSECIILKGYTKNLHSPNERQLCDSGSREVTYNSKVERVLSRPSLVVE